MNKIIKISSFRMLVFSDTEKRDLTEALKNRKKFESLELDVDEKAMLDSVNFGTRIWLVKGCKIIQLSESRNTLQLSPRNEPKYAQLNLGISDLSIGQEIKDILDLINLPIYVRIGCIYFKSQKS